MNVLEDILVLMVFLWLILVFIVFPVLFMRYARRTTRLTAQLDSLKVTLEDLADTVTRQSNALSKLKKAITSSMKVELPDKKHAMAPSVVPAAARKVATPSDEAIRKARRVSPRYQQHRPEDTVPVPHMGEEVIRKTAEGRSVWMGAFPSRIRAWLFGGNPLARLGVLILFLGIAFGLKYAIDAGLLTKQMGHLAAGAFGVILSGVGWRVRQLMRNYGLVLQGGGAGIVFLTVFSAVNLADLLSPEQGFPLMVAAVAAGSALAVLQDALGLALLSLVGGFLAPILVSINEDPVALFSYCLILSGGILTIAWFKAWRGLNLVGFFSVLAIGTLWAHDYYQPFHYSVAQAFLVLFFLFFTAVPIIFALRQPPRLKGYIDGLLVFGVPFCGFALQSQLVNEFDDGLWMSSASLALFYAVVVIVGRRSKNENFRVLNETFLALSVAFGTVTVPLAVDNARLTGGIWALEGLVLVWVGVRQRNLIARFFGLATEVAAAVGYAGSYLEAVEDVPILNGHYLGAVVIGLSGLFGGFYLYTQRQALRNWEKVYPAFLLCWGAVWWFFAGADEIRRHVGSDDQLVSLVFFLTANSIALSLLGRRFAWSLLNPVGALVLAATALAWLDPSVFWLDSTIKGFSADLSIDKIAPIITEETPVFNARFVSGGAIVVAAFLFSAALLYRRREFEESVGYYANAEFALGFSWALMVGSVEILRHVSLPDSLGALLYFVAGSTVVATLLRRPFGWQPLSRPALVLLPVMAAIAAALYLRGTPPHQLALWAFLGWFVAFAVQYWLFRRTERDWNSKLLIVWQSAALSLALLLMAWESSCLVGELVPDAPTWRSVFWIPVPAIAVFVLLSRDGSLRWPFTHYSTAGCDAGLLPTVTALMFWVAFATMEPGDPFPWQYRPVLNPLELGQLLALAGLTWWLSHGCERLPGNVRWGILSGIAFVALNGIVARSVHFIDDVPFNISAIWASFKYQAAISITWSVAAFVAMVIATKTKERMLWIVGATLLVAVVAKLFLMDLAGTGTVTRIVSFLGVGILILIGAYLSPLPPRAEQSS
jgi:uncharacterized membrane protein